MTGITNRNIFAELEAFEAAAFRIGQLARRLRTEHPDLPVRTINPTLWALDGATGPNVHAELEIECGSVDGVQAWAKVLDVEATVTTSTTNPYELAAAEAVIVGVTVKVSGTRTLTGDEHAAWRAKQDQAADGTSAGGGAQ